MKLSPTMAVRVTKHGQTGLLTKCVNQNLRVGGTMLTIPLPVIELGSEVGLSPRVITSVGTELSYHVHLAQLQMIDFANDTALMHVRYPGLDLAELADFATRYRRETRALSAPLRLEWVRGNGAAAAGESFDGWPS